MSTAVYIVNSFKTTTTINGALSGTASMSHYKKSKTNLDFTEARESKWQWH